VWTKARSGAERLKGKETSAREGAATMCQCGDQLCSAQLETWSSGRGCWPRPSRSPSVVFVPPHPASGARNVHGAKPLSRNEAFKVLSRYPSSPPCHDALIASYAVLAHGNMHSCSGLCCRLCRSMSRRPRQTMNNDTNVAAGHELLFALQSAYN
jgi:hypothetical protein